jgi:hypothetical protein
MIRIKVEPNDQGPVYRETDMSRMPVEPWSTFSNLIFLAVFIYFAFKTKFSYRKFPMLVIFLSILLIGWIGGTVYHATRSHNIWLMLDYMPIMFIILMASIYFWREVVGKWILVFTFTLLPIIIYRLIYEVLTLPHSISISIGYSVMALIVVIPLILHCVYRNPKAWKFLAGALISFAIAITFRILDEHSGITLAMGTHFLWHLFGGSCCFFMFYYIYESEKIKIPILENKIVEIDFDNLQPETVEDTEYLSDRQR